MPGQRGRSADGKGALVNYQDIKRHGWSAEPPQQPWEPFSAARNEQSQAPVAPTGNSETAAPHMRQVLTCDKVLASRPWLARFLFALRVRNRRAHNLARWLSISPAFRRYKRLD